MPRFCANISIMYQELPFEARFAAASKDGFSGVEFWLPYAWPAEYLLELAQNAGIEIVNFNACAGNWDYGERGIAAALGREDDFKKEFEQALHYAKVIGNNKIHVMAGYVDFEEQRGKQSALYYSNLSNAALLANREGIQILIEPINHRDMPGYFLHRQSQAVEICREIDAENLKVQFDIYHCQITEGDISRHLREGLFRTHGKIAHIQIAGVPDRGEPDDGEINYSYLFKLMDDLGYTGWVSCEYRPRAGTSAGLGWLNAWKNE